MWGKLLADVGVAAAVPLVNVFAVVVVVVIVYAVISGLE